MYRSRKWGFCLHCEICKSLFGSHRFGCRASKHDREMRSVLRDACMKKDETLHRQARFKVNVINALVRHRRRQGAIRSQRSKIASGWGQGMFIKVPDLGLVLSAGCIAFRVADIGVGSSPRVRRKTAKGKYKTRKLKFFPGNREHFCWRGAKG